MANLTIFGLTQLTSAGADIVNDLVPVWDNDVAETKKMTLSDLRNLMSPVNWSDSFSSTTQATSSWTPNNAAANINAAIRPKGTGAITAAIPDGTAVGGNARGTYAVDLQMVRTAADQVARGNQSAILSGQNNRISSNRTNTFSVIGGGNGNLISQLYGSTIAGGNGNTIGDNDGWSCTVGGGETNTIRARLGATIVGGSNNTISSGGDFAVIGGRANNSSGQSAGILSGMSNTANGNYSFIGGGQSNTASQSHAVVSGGKSNTASGTHSVVGGGETNTANNSWATVDGGYINTAGNILATVGGGGFNSATGFSSVIPGGMSASTTLYGQLAHAAGQFSAAGDAQAHELVWRAEYTGYLTYELFLDGLSLPAVLPGTNSVWHGIMDVSAVCNSTGDGTTVEGDVIATSYKVTIKRIGTTTSLVGTVQEIGTTNADASMATGFFTIDNNDTNESLRIQFTPPNTAFLFTITRAIATFRGQQIQY